jgi:hypothetical protein
VQAGGRNAVHEDERRREEDFSECTEETDMNFVPFTHNRKKHPVYDGFRLRASPRHGGQEAGILEF